MAQIAKESPLHCACICGHLAIVRALSEDVRVDINIRDSKHVTIYFKFNITSNTQLQFVPLHWAIMNGHVEIIKLLLSHEKIQPNVRSIAGVCKKQTSH